MQSRVSHDLPSSDDPSRATSCPARGRRVFAESLRVVSKAYRLDYGTQSTHRVLRPPPKRHVRPSLAPARPRGPPLTRSCGPAASRLGSSSRLSSSCGPSSPSLNSLSLLPLPRRRSSPHDAPSATPKLNKGTKGRGILLLKAKVLPHRRPRSGRRLGVAVAGILQLPCDRLALYVLLPTSHLLLAPSLPTPRHSGRYPRRNVDGRATYDKNEGFTNAQALLNVFESLANFAYLYKSLVRHDPDAVAVGFASVVATFSKTVLVRLLPSPALPTRSHDPSEQYFAQECPSPPFPPERPD